MYKDKKIGVVVPAYNEENLIVKTLEGIPYYVDRIFVVNDGSKDCTPQLVETRRQLDPRIQVIQHEVNKGLGMSIIDGYRASLETDVEITAVMDGDNQMHPDDLPNLLDSLIEEKNDYAKGNRLLHQDIRSMPFYRFLGTSLLTILTKFATGYYALMDPQCAFTAIKNSALRQIPIQEMTRGYGYNAEVLCMLNIQNYSVTNVEVRPVYGEEKSKIKLWKYIPKTSLILIRLFFKRLWRRYIVKDFNPLVLFYLFAFFNVIVILIPFTVRFFYMYFTTAEFPRTTFTILVFTFLITLQSIFFAIWMDMDYNRKR